MHKHSICIGLAASLLSGPVSFTPGGSIEKPPANQRLIVAAPATSVERGERPREEYEKLREQAFARAKIRQSLTVRNPRISADGLDTAVLSRLQTQHAYLEQHRALLSGSHATEDPTNVTTYGSQSGPAAEKSVNAELSPRPALTPLATKEPAAGMCHTPAIHSVNGKSNGAVFTPQSPNNYYKIEGCSFGTHGGRVQLEPDSRGTPARNHLQPIPLQLDSAMSWSDGEIDVHLSSRLSGIPDFPAVLVIYPADGHRLELTGCLFVAVRGEPQLLSAIPASWVKLQASAVRSHSIQQLEYVSPPVSGSEVPNDSSGASSFVVRFDQEQFASGNDTYDFSHLNPGWVVDKVQVQTYAVSCPGEVTYAQSLRRWDVSWDKRGFTVAWQEDVCASNLPPFSNFNLSFSEYAAKVWVIGPIGTQPLTHGLR
jgi:hypothetical protein